MDELLRQAVTILRGMWHRRWIGLAVAWVVGVVGAVVLLRIHDRYEATARIYVDTQSVLKPLMAGMTVQPNVEQRVSMLARTLISRPNLEKLIRTADLDLLVSTPRERDQLVDSLASGIKFASDGRGDNLYQVSYRDTQPERAKRVVQNLVSMFVESGQGNKRRDSESAKRFIEDQIKVYEKKLEEAENRLKEFRIKNMDVTGGAGKDYLGRMTALNEEISKAKLELRAAEESRDALKRELAGEDEPMLVPDVPVAGAASVVPELDARIDAQKRQLDELLRRFTDLHPDVQGTRRLIAQLEEQKKREVEAIRKASAASSSGRPAPSNNRVLQQLKISLAEAEANVASLRARVGELTSRVEHLRASAARVPQIEAEMAQLNRDYEVLHKNYEQLVARRESANLSEEVDATAQIGEFRLIDPPRVSDKAVFPNRMALIPLVLAVSLAAGIFASFAVSQVFPTVQDGRALRTICNRPVLGSVSLLVTDAYVRKFRILNSAFGSGVAGLIVVYGAWVAWLYWLNLRG
jgi:polysaccharide chain length determinant protein (PEP-CTERM system associated)